MKQKLERGKKKISKALENDVMEVHNLFWESYARRDIELRFSLCSEDVTFIGSGLNERAINKSEYKKINKAGVKQFPDAFKIKFLWTHFTLVNENVACVESEVVWSQLINKKESKELLRNTTLLKCKNNRWLITHVHGSVPDYRLKEGDYMTNEQTIIRNQELERQVFDRTQALNRTLEDLEQKNRELEIETALEKVRAIAMGMKKPDDMLDVCKTISLQLESLGVKEIRNVQTAIFYETKKTYINFEYYTKHNKSLITEVDYRTHELQELFANKMIKGVEELFSETLKSKEVKDWYAYQKTTNQFADSFLETAESLSYYWYSLGPVALGMSTYVQLNEQEISLFNRFRNVFELAYRRYLDIEQAEAQAREAKIEAALEKIRSRALAMRYSSEVGNVSTLLFIELEKMDINPSGFSIMIFNEEQDKHELWRAKEVANQGAYETFSIKGMYDKFDQYVPGFSEELKSAWTKGNPFFVGEFRGEKRFLFLQANREMANYSDEAFEKMKKGWPDPTFWHLVFFKYGWFGVLQNEQLIKEDLLLIHRLAEVFDFAYTRFLDLQKAEAQAREARIETALERVRAVAMAMHKPEDLSAIGKTIFTELKSLGFAGIRNTEMVINKDEKETVISYHYSDYGQEEIIEIEYKTNLIVKQWAQDLRKAEDAFVPVSIPESQIKSWDNYRIELGYKSDPKMAEAKAVYYYSYSIRLGALSISTWQTLSDEQIKILERFRNVFNLSYKRYSDISLAESQAREAQIQLALERVRAKSLAMHHTSELQEVVNIVAQQLHKIGMDINGGVFIAINDEVDKDIPLWASGGAADYVQKVIVPILNKPVFIQLRDAIRRKNNFFIEEHSREEKIDLFQHLFNYPPWNSHSQQRKQELLSREGGYTRSVVVSNYTSISITNHNGKKFSDSDNEILKRFGNVFEQSYIRFLDLQKAEAQAREAQIELALERVRARTMVMQKSGELAETAYILFQQFGLLGASPEQLTIAIIDETHKELEFWLTLGGNQMNRMFKAPINEPIVLNRLYFAWQEQNKSLVIDISGDELKAYYNFYKSLPDYKVFNDFKDSQRPEHRRVIHSAFFSNGWLSVSTPEPIPAEAIQLLERFAAVFDGTYIRFLDLQKAEAQAREAQIEAALERVRSRTMGMQKSEELKDVIRVVYEQFVHLKINVDHAGFVVDYTPKGDWHFWIADEQDIPSKITHPYFESVWANQFNEAKEKGADFFATNLNFEEKNKFYTELLSYVPGLPETSKDFYLSCPGLSAITVLFDNVSLYIENFSGIPYSDEENKILMRFGKVFQQTYTRFLDLQKAEAQAREAQIELALERVRARTMAMHKSEELSETAHELFQQFKEIDKEPKMLTIGLINENEGLIEFWVTDWSGGGSKVNRKFNASIDEPILLNKIYTAWREKRKSIVIELPSKELQGWVKYRISLSGIPDDNDYSNSRGFVAASFFSNGMLSISTYEPLSTETVQLLERFAGVFNLTYTRFLDLQKAEAQAREAKIEAALERVRARTMAMHESNELSETAAVLFKQLIDLGIAPNRLYIAIMKDESGNAEFWITDEDGSKVSSGFSAKMNDNSSFQKMFSGWIEKKKSITIDMKGKELQEYFEHLGKLNVPFKGGPSQKRRVQNIAYFSQGFIGIASPDLQSEETINLLERFAAVFNLTYRRFLDLEKAEAQAREAQIEASLEKVRAVALSLKKSDEMLDIAQVLYEQLLELGFTTIRNAIIDIHNDSNETFLDYDYSHYMGRTITLMSYYDDPIIEKQVREIESSSDAFFEIILEGKELQDLIDIRLKNGEAEDPRLRQIEQLTYNLYSFGNGAIGISNFGVLSDEQKIVLKRFRNVFTLAYKRYNDLIQTENQAREVKRQASLDRIRGEIASMRTSEDLNRITPIIWRELKTLEVPFIRCGVFIIDELNKSVRIYLTTHNGQPLGALNLSFDKNKLTNDTVEHWRKKQIYKEHWNREEFISWTKSMIEIGQIQNAETYQGSADPPEFLDLHFVPFAQGMLYVGNTIPLTDSELELVKSLSEAFSIAYARYEDFKKLEDAKNKVEATLTELKAAQAQLIHSEKMASLGELTAGIAHEIKNPLNFINNFSEISTELLDEMQTELHNNGSQSDDVKEIVNNLKHNLEKINQHGKRADSIVKGMLLHSRGNSGEKALTNINDLLDQYVNLAYHGLRAQNKEFNVAIEKDYDMSLEKINVVPQDLSRVFLNIVNNACYAAFKKKLILENDFIPTIKVATKKLNDKIEIRIRDNGSGISNSIRKQIFNPFFTTKPTGEGTGLGLSLSYDIVVKQHLGSLEFDTKEGEFTEFLITLPK